MSEFYRNYMALATIASGLMTESHIVGLTDAFFFIDMDHDGVVTAADLHAMLGNGTASSVVLGDFIMKHGLGDIGTLWTSDEYLNGMTEGFLVFTDDLVRPGSISTIGASSEVFLRRIKPEFYDDDHIERQMSYTEFMRLIIANHIEATSDTATSQNP